MYLKIHKAGDNRFVAAICDEDLIGKVLEDGKIYLEVSEHFYKGKILSEDEILKEIKDIPSINIVGKKSIDFAIKHNIIKKESIIIIKGVPHGQAYA